MTDLKPCPFCGGKDVEIEGKGQLWRGVEGYSDPQYYVLRHFGHFEGDDDFPACHVYFRARTVEDLKRFWERE